MQNYQGETLGRVQKHTPAETISRDFGKTAFDVVLSFILLVPLTFVAIFLMVANPFFNKGSLVFRQTRMGQDCRPFTAFKFRTMLEDRAVTRGAFDALEVDRITGFGRFVRKMRLDELPQIINILRGEMSLIGPRPDSYDHACVYLQEIPGYAQRHKVIPGISGFAQTEVGYVDGLDGILRKVNADLYYLKHASFRFEMWIVWRTLCVVLGRKGS
jgi:lipopolysaccharide/colanic/teichoic acid biosynthesis glycosyltransferase